MDDKKAFKRNMLLGELYKLELLIRFETNKRKLKKYKKIYKKLEKQLDKQLTETLEKTK